MDSLLEILLQNNANRNIINKIGKSPIDLAEDRGNLINYAHFKLSVQLNLGKIVSG